MPTCTRVRARMPASACTRSRCAGVSRGTRVSAVRTARRSLCRGRRPRSQRRRAVRTARHERHIDPYLPAPRLGIGDLLIRDRGVAVLDRVGPSLDLLFEFEVRPRVGVAHVLSHALVSLADGSHTRMLAPRCKNHAARSRVSLLAARSA